MKTNKNKEKITTIITMLLIMMATVNAYTEIGCGVCNCGDGTTTNGGSNTDACIDCTAALNDNINCNSQVNYVGTITVNNYVGTCINSPAGFNNKIFDCQGNTIDGDNTGNDFGIILDGKTGNTIRNCKITGFREGIDIRGTGGDNNQLINNTANENTLHGIYIGTHGNTLTGNTANNNQRIGVYIVHVLNNVLNENTFCNNNQEGGSFEDIVSLDVTTGDNNRCDTTDNYDDEGTTGCTYTCSQQQVPEFNTIGIILIILTTPGIAYLITRKR
ncbi:MAG: right-handed parallel beta-helix repeat-containing protein [Candidatus Altiarchaeota archaeon]|nr:right-handed parallel beta-helix repeat-containing protein [Candidatus Altiarchaeota archaeon]